MSQGEVIDILKKQKEPIPARKIAEMLDINEKRVYVLINCLLHYDEIKCIEITRGEAMEKYSCKRRMRLYYVA